MPTDVFEESLDLRIGLLEAVAPASPYPLLRPTGQEETRTFAAILLENAYLRVTVLPGLGGRILSIFDKRTSTEILNPAAPHPRHGGRRGARLVGAGLQLLLDDGDRPNDLGPVDFQIEEPPETVWLAEAAGGTGLSFHLRIELPPERAELRLEARILNRTRRPVFYNGALALEMGTVHTDGEVAWSPARRAGLRLRSDELEHGYFSNNRYTRARFSELALIGPRQTDAWSAVLTPFSGLDGLPEVSDDAAAFLGGAKVQVQSVGPLPGARLLLGLSDGQTLEAPADLYPEHVLDVPLESLPAKPVALIVQDAERTERLRLQPKEPAYREPYAPFLPGSPAPSELDAPPVGAQDERGLRRLVFAPAPRALAHLELGHRAIARGEYAEADEHLENALLYNGDDPLNWWTKAMVRRLAGAEDEGPELPNAHYLAPLEPALRAEAFLASPQSGLVAPLADKPELLVEVACLLLEVGARAEASRWIDEALHHRDVAMLRYLHAWSLLDKGRLETEAALHIAAAGRLLLEAPYPWREIEAEALRDLRTRFPNDKRLDEYAELVERARSV